MAIPGTKEKQVRALREAAADDLTIPNKLRRGHPDCVVKTGAQPAPAKASAPKPATVERTHETPVRAAAPQPPAPPPTEEKESVMRTTSTSRKANKARTKVTGKTAGKKTKLEIVGKLLAREGGCTANDVKKATGWPSVSMPAMATALGVELVTDKKPGELTRYSIKANKARA